MSTLSDQRLGAVVRTWVYKSSEYKNGSFFGNVMLLGTKPLHMVRTHSNTELCHQPQNERLFREVTGQRKKDQKKINTGK
jgi:hypothetical protein